MNGSVGASYDRIAGWYNSRRHVWSNKRELEEFAAELPHGGSVLDLGCGAGYASKYLTKKGFDVTGVDISRGMLELARRKVPPARFLRGDMRSLTFAPRSFDGVVSLYSIIHLPKENHRSILNGLPLVMKQEGTLLLCTGFDDWTGTEDDWLGTGSPMYWSHFDSVTNLRMLKSAGFDVIWSRESKKRDGRHLFVLARLRSKTSG